MNARLRAVPATTPKAVLYLRQSVARDDSVSMELQEIAGRDYCARQGYEVAAVERDEGISGRTWTKRPAVQRVMDMIERREVDIIVLWKWSRLSRSRKDWALAADRVDVAGGRIESATEPIDTATASGRFARGVMTEYSAFQSEQIGEQWNETHSRRYNLGLPPTGILPWGWESHRTYISITDENADVIREMYRRYNDGHGTPAIMNWLNGLGIKAKRGGEWTPRSVVSCLDSPIHRGNVVYRGVVKEGLHDAIIDEATWVRYQTVRSERAHQRGRNDQHNYLLTGLVHCLCGAKRYGMTVHGSATSGGAIYQSYTCRASHPTKSASCARVHPVIISWLKSLDEVVGSEAPTEIQADVEFVTREILAIDRKLERLTRQLLDDIVPEVAYKQTRDSLMVEREQHEQVLATYERQRHAPASSYLTGKTALIERWDTIPLAAKQDIVQALIERVTFESATTITIRSRWGIEYGPFEIDPPVRHRKG